MEAEKEELKVGDVVRVERPDRYLIAFANKIRDRDGVIEWVGPDANGHFRGLAWVRFLKRNGRGKEFRERMSLRDLVRQTPNAAAQPTARGGE